MQEKYNNILNLFLTKTTLAYTYTEVYYIILIVFFFQQNEYFLPTYTYIRNICKLFGSRKIIYVLNIIQSGNSCNKDICIIENK